MLVTALTLVTAAVPADALRYAATLLPIDEARLELSSGYLSVAPLSDVLDTLTLMTVPQHVAILVWAAALFALWRMLRRRTRPTSVKRECLAGGGALLAVVLVYVFGALSPRPMAQLVTSDPAVIAVDFHSHTMYSHDGRPGWTAEDVRSWHRAAGFDAVYITDHATFEGAERGIAANPAQAGQGTMVLQGLEVVYKGEHVNILNAGRRYRGLTTPDLKDLDARSLQLAGLLAATSPVLVETVPANLGRVPAREPASPGVNAIEIVDGSPRGLAQGRRERQRILHIADSLDAALVAGSDNHGWGRTAPAWTLLRIPGWRGMTTDSLSRQIENVLRVGRRQGTRTVERRVAEASNAAAVALAPALVTWRMFTMLTSDERVMWVIWAWGLVLVVRGLHAYRIRPSATT